MNYEHLTDDELIVAVAEAKGWKSAKIDPIKYKDGSSLIIGISPSGLPGISVPHYRQPSEYMALMEEIWKAKPGSLLAINGVVWNLRDGNYCDGVFGDYPRWRAIAIAWMMICGKENEDE